MIAAMEGPSALSARRLAAESGTTTAAIYTLFGGMDSLRAALTAQSLGELSQAMADADERVRREQGGGTPLERFLAIAHAYRGWAVTHPNEYRSILSDGLGLAVRRAADGRSADGEPRAVAAPPVPVTAPDVFLDSVDEAWHASLSPLHSAVAAGMADGSFSGDPHSAASMTVKVWASLHGLVSLELVGVLVPTLLRMDPDAGTERFFDDALARVAAGLVAEPVTREAHA